MIGILKAMISKSDLEMLKKHFIFMKFHLKLALIMQTLISEWQVAKKFLDNMNKLFKIKKNT